MSAIDSQAQDILDKFWDGMLPVDIVKMANNMGVSVESFKTEDTESKDRVISSLQVIHPSHGLITVNVCETPMRVRYAVAHALAHFIQGDIKDPAQHCYTLGSFQSKTSLPQDNIANQLAVRLLVPTRVMKYAIDHKKINTLEKLTDLFDVSQVLIHARLVDEGIVQRSQPAPSKKMAPR